MLAFRIQDMSCGCCAGTLMRALRDADPAARVEISLHERLVRIEPAQAAADEFREAIVDAGYTPVLLDQGEGAARPSAPGGCCCGEGAH